MESTLKFRVLSWLFAAGIGILSMSSLMAELFRSPSTTITVPNAKAPSPDELSAAEISATIAPFRSDLGADYAIKLANQTLTVPPAERAQTNPSAQSAIRSALGASPHDSRLWFALSLLQSQNGDALANESLRMSYLTGPNTAELIPSRLDNVTSKSALNDADLGELARSDVRAMLRRQRQSLLEIYTRASAVGKKFIEESSRTIDPDFADQLRTYR